MCHLPWVWIRMIGIVQSDSSYISFRLMPAAWRYLGPSFSNTNSRSALVKHSGRRTFIYQKDVMIITEFIKSMIIKFKTFIQRESSAKLYSLKLLCSSSLANLYTRNCIFEQLCNTSSLIQNPFFSMKALAQRLKCNNSNWKTHTFYLTNSCLQLFPLLSPVYQILEC